jgi:2-keto-4-pentenoate hydratase/2-oxohepta-3-ene-1,7-dioic acid hydratase in catechol pathway
MFATYVANGTSFWGVVADGGMIALSPDFPQWKTLRNVIEAGGLEEVANAASGRPVTHPHGSFTYEIPVPDPEKIICVGVNFPDRNAEYKDGQEAPPNMSLFIRFPRSFVGHGAADPSARDTPARL